MFDTCAVCGAEFFSIHEVEAHQCPPKYEVLLHYTNDLPAAMSLPPSIVFAYTVDEAVSLVARDNDSNSDNKMFVKTGELRYAWAKKAFTSDPWVSYTVVSRPTTEYTIQRT